MRIAGFEMIDSNTTRKGFFVMSHVRAVLLVTLVPSILSTLGLLEAGAADPIDIGSRLELFVDEALIDRLDGVERRLHHPVPQEIVLVAGEPWEGNTCAYFTVFPDGDRYRMYYRGHGVDTESGKAAHREVVCYAESDDGIEWRKPVLGLVEFGGSKDNNIIWDGIGSHDFTPFRDANPDATSAAAYKAFGNGGDPVALYAIESADGIHWSLASDEPVITTGKFDSQNLGFWDPVRKEYRAYVRDFRDGNRDIRTATSPDFIHWTEPVWLEYPGVEAEQLYTNQIAPYYRAPHIFIGFPTRYIDRGEIGAFRTLPDYDARRGRAETRKRWGTAITEGLLMSSRDGRTFHRFAEAFLRPGPRLSDDWAYGDDYIAWHAVETASSLDGYPRELSLYGSEGYWIGDSTALRRYTIRIDGFVSLHAPMKGGLARTRPLRFDGDRLVVNYATSAAGGLRVGLLDEEDRGIDGFRVDDCDEIFGDELERVVTWKGSSDLETLRGKVVRLEFALRDADLWSFRFATRE